ncbi:MAG: hypothetical protein AAFZ18_21925 [Myxococcota bacterium]
MAGPWAPIALAVCCAALAPRAYARPVTSDRAEAALELALAAEIAGDAEGAEAAIRGLVRDAESRDEAVARQVLQDWLRARSRRVPGLAAGASAGARAATWSSLEPFSSSLHTQAWTHWTGQNAQLGAPLPRLRVRLDRVLGVPRGEFRGLLDAALDRQALRRGEGPLELAVTLDASDETTRGRWVEVRAQLEFVLSSTAALGGTPLARFSRARTERRREGARAARFAARRIAQDAAARVLFVLRQERLRQRAAGARTTPPETEPEPR